AVAGAVERLAGCQAVRWWIADHEPLTNGHPLVRGWGTAPGVPAGEALTESLRAHNTWEEGWVFQQRPALTPASFAGLAAELMTSPPDLLLSGGDALILALSAALARRCRVPAILVAHFAGRDPSAAVLTLLPSDEDQGREWPDLLSALGNPTIRDPAHLPCDMTAWHTWAAANGLAALWAKAMLTHGGPHADVALDSLFWREHRTAALLGDAAWPWATRYINLATAGPRPAPAVHVIPTEPDLARGAALIVGCGSLGSLAARAVVASGALRDLVLVDGETVDTANPVRQFFHTPQVGQPKAVALARNLAALAGPSATWEEAVPADGSDMMINVPAGRYTAVVQHFGADPSSLAAFRRLLRVTRPGVVVLATGSHVDYALARVLRGLGIPHVVGRCYPRARYFEVIVVDGRRGPCFGCLRGHLYTGPTAAPTPEERLRYDAPPGSGELAAEPATVVESGRAADVLAHLAAALAQPRGKRPGWLAALLASRQTCLIGGNTAAWRPDPAGGGKGWAYGVQYPGQVVAFGLAQVLGTEAAQICPDCGRQLAVVHRIAPSEDSCIPAMVGTPATFTMP
ncbi:MAG TPA: ThiF family adenylyltransferase, partial [Chloroflexia bacterium]|nr:ThiF family adenylyltransferase [Chloroflexia bacterium]